MKPSIWLLTGISLLALSAVLVLVVDSGGKAAAAGRDAEGLQPADGAAALGIVPRAGESSQYLPEGSGSRPSRSGVATSDPNRERDGRSAGKDPGAPPSKRPGRSSKGLARTFLVSRNLAPDMEVVKGLVEGAIIEGPVVVTGRQGRVAIKSASVGPGGAERQVDNLVVFQFGVDKEGDYFGEFVVEAADGQATSEGIRFSGPLKLKMQNQHGSWYEFVSHSTEAFVLVSRDGQRKLFAAPKGQGSFPEVDPTPPSME